jgi:GAF domain-containing protein
MLRGRRKGDPAILALQTHHRPADLREMRSAFRGEYAYPMAVGGRLVGVLILGPKRSGDPYAPDESRAIAELAREVGAALAVHALDAENKSLPEAIAQRLGRLGAQRGSGLGNDVLRRKPDQPQLWNRL